MSAVNKADKPAAAQVMPSGTTSGTPQLLLGHHLKQLKLPTILREYDKVAREAAREGIDHAAYLLRLVELELIDRERRVVERRIRQARFPAVKSLDTFEFTAIPSLNKMLALELARLANTSCVATTSSRSATAVRARLTSASVSDWRLPERVLGRFHDGGGFGPSAHGGPR